MLRLAVLLENEPAQLFKFCCRLQQAGSQYCFVFSSMHLPMKYPDIMHKDLKKLVHNLKLLQ